MTWRNRRNPDTGEIHVTPVDDLALHLEDCSCPCRPVRDMDNPVVVVHNSLDGREAAEQLDG